MIFNYYIKILASHIIPKTNFVTIIHYIYYFVTFIVFLYHITDVEYPLAINYD